MSERRLAMAWLYAYRQLAGLCLTCGRPIDRFVRCPDCRRDQARAAQTRRRRMTHLSP